MKSTNTMFQWCLTLCLMLSTTIFSGREASAQKAQLVDRNGEVQSGTLQEQGRSVTEQDSLALVAVYHALNGADWDDKSGWLTEMVEFWHGVQEVSEIETTGGVFEWRVTRINLQGNFLVGELPPEIGMLNQVTLFNVSQNLLIGTVPREVAGMTALIELRFSNNKLMTGRPPWEDLVLLPNLTHIYAGHNNHTGEIPAVIGDFPQLRVGDFKSSPYSGPFPEQISQISTLERFEFALTFLTGPIPESLAELENLNYMNLSRNVFLEPGPLPEWICEHSELRTVQIAGARRTGPIPACYGMMENLGNLWVGGPSDELTGEIPDFTFAAGLTFLRILNSDITGPIPAYLGEMPALRTLHLQGLNVSGPIPQSLASAPSLSQIYLKDLPNVEGPMPDFRNLNLTRFRIQNLGFDIGPFPDWIETQTGMSQMRLEGVGLTGSVPESWSALTNLQWLKIENNPGITGELPSWVTNGNQMLREMRLGGTNIDLGADGQIPEWLCNMEQLQHIRLNNMGLTGSIPECLGDLIRLGTIGDLGREGWLPHTIDFSNNQLSGEIPASLGNLSFVNGIDLSNNQLSGAVPQEFFSIGRIGQASVLEVMDLSGNPDLTGPISTDITNYSPALLRIAHFNDTDLCEPTDTGLQNWFETMEETQTIPIIFMGFGGRSIKRAEPCGSSSVGLDELPVRFALHQNYPNPFNPSTIISYSIPSEVHVELVVYDLLGQRVATLVNETVSAGQYEINFDASGLSSGVYIYRLVTDKQNLSHTMTLVK